MSLSQEEKALSYALPILQSGAEGADWHANGGRCGVWGRSRRHTVYRADDWWPGWRCRWRRHHWRLAWLREMVVRMMPGDEATKPGHAHNEMLKKLHLLDENNKPTWFTNGKPDIGKGLAIAGPVTDAMPPEERLPFTMGAFGRRGGGAYSVLANNQMLERARQLREGIENSGNRQRYETLDEDIRNNTTKGTARSTLQTFNVGMIELGTTVLPAVVE
jgi:hypothetical protein